MKVYTNRALQIFSGPLEAAEKTKWIERGQGPAEKVETQNSFVHKAMFRK
jgi:hypothetical protein